MLLLRFLVRILAIGVVTLGVGSVSAQTFPSKPIRLLTAEAGGGADFMARLIAQGLAGNLGQPVIVENLGSASGIVLMQTVAKAPPDGYTLVLYISTQWILPLMQEVPYDAEKDFAPVTIAASSPNILVVHPSLAAKSVKELIALAKANPGSLNYGTGSSGGTSHLAAELLNSMAGVKIVHVGYKGGARALTALLGGEVQLIFSGSGTVAPLIKAEKLRPLAVTSAQPSVLLPGLPTMAASGLPGYDAVTPYFVSAPSKTPTAIINRLNQEFVQVVNRIDVKEKFLGIGVETVGSSPEQLSALIKSDIAKWSKIIKDAGIHID